MLEGASVAGVDFSAATVAAGIGMEVEEVCEELAFKRLSDKSKMAQHIVVMQKFTTCSRKS